MEIAVPIALAIAGIQLNRSSGKTIREEETDRTLYVPNDYEQVHEEGTVIQDGKALFETIAVQRTEEETSKPHNNMRPFFRSSGTQNNIRNLSERKLDTFTGSSRMKEYRKKDAVENLFAPTADKKPQESFLHAVDRYEKLNNEKMILNNVQPFQKQQVGPGLGLGYDVTARDTGFQENLRILPDNVNSYRKHSHEGRIKIGASTVENGTQRPVLRDPTNDLSGPSYEKGMTGAAFGYIRGDAHRPVVVQKEQFRNHIEYTGITNAIGPTATSSRAPIMTKFNNDDNAREHVGITSGHQLGGFLTAGLNVIDTNRGEENVHVLGGHNPTQQKTVNYITRDQFATQRGSENEWIVGGKGTATRGNAYETDYNVETQRGTRQDLLMSGASHVSAGEDRMSAMAFHENTHTNRENLNAARPGAGARGTHGVYNNASAIDLNHKREAMLTGYTPGAGRSNHLADPQNRVGSITAREAINTVRSPLASGTHNTEGMTLGSVHGGRAMSSENPRSRQLDLTRQQLASNPYNVLD